MGCYDLDGEDEPEAYCGVCQNEDKRCNGGLQTCGQGLWSTPVDCTMTSGWTCFDPSPTGGTDAYCGLCLKNTAMCAGDDRQVCDAQGTVLTTTTCPFGCNQNTDDCCVAPTCGARVCGPSPANACGFTISCGSCTRCCRDGLQCCGSNQVCCGGTACCGPLTQCINGVCG